jgi:long-chain fatty acid transport protein
MVIYFETIYKSGNYSFFRLDLGIFFLYNCSNICPAKRHNGGKIMKKLLGIFTVSAICILSFASLVSAAGFALPEQSASAMGMASAVTAQADDASTVWYNPAGMTSLDGTKISGGMVAIYPTFTHENSDGTTDVGKRGFHFPVDLYGAQKIDNRISLGIGINNPFGLSTNWSQSSKTSQVATESEVKTYEVNPNIAYKITDALSVAVGVAYVKLDATLKNVQNINPVPPPFIFTNSSLSGDGDGWGGNVAALYKASEKFSTGFSYRSRVKIDIDGTAELTGVAKAPASTSITLPDLLQWGVSYKATDKLTLNTDLGYTWWSTYDKIAVTSSNPIFNNKTYDKKWKDVWNLRIGAQYKLVDELKLRAGLQYDKNPVPDKYFETRVPDSDRVGVSIGTGYAIGNLTVDVAYLYLKFLTRHIDDSVQDDATSNPNSLNGTYKTDVHVAALNISYKF